MPEIINCPQCERKLRVPDDLLGQQVKCPTCSTTFTATAAPSEAPAPAPQAAPAPAPPPPPPAAPYPRYDMPPPTPGYPRYDVPPPYPGAPGQQPRYDQGAPLDFDDPHERRRQLRPAAMSAVAGPAIALLVVGIIGIVGSVLGVCAGIFTSAAGPQARRGGGFNNDGFEGIFTIFFYGVMLVASIVVVACSTKMKRLDSYAAAMTASILAVIPCLSPCFVLGIPFGIWGLIVINQADVKEAFYS
jgi:predicted Zn finger-like uncharacterized protein